MSNPSTPPLAPNQADKHPNTQTSTQTLKQAPAPKAQESTRQNPHPNKAKPKAHADKNAPKNPTRESTPHSAHDKAHARASHSPTTKPSPKPSPKPTPTKTPKKIPQEKLPHTARAPQSHSPQPHNPKKPDSIPLTPSKSTPPHETHELIEVAKLGKSIGVHGALKCHLLTDFPEIFQKGVKFFAIFSSPCEKITHPLTLQTFDPQRHLITFEEITSMEAAKSLTNFILHSTLEDTRKHCALGKEEFFWFDIIGCRVCEAGILLGEVREIQRIGATDYLLVRTDSTLQKSASLAKEFLIPYIAPFIKDTDLEAKTIYTQNAKALLEAS